MSGKKILIIDDEPLIREVARIALEAVGKHQVFVAGSGEAGLALAASERPDLILLDVQMPGLDGPSTLDRLKADPALCTLPVLMLTAQSLAPALRDLEARGAAGIVAKPFEPHALAGQIARMVGWEPTPRQDDATR